MGQFSAEDVENRLQVARLDERMLSVRAELTDVRHSVDELENKVDAIAVSLQHLQASMDKLNAAKDSTFLTKAGAQSIGGVLMAAILYLLQQYGLPVPATEKEAPSAEAK